MTMKSSKEGKTDKIPRKKTAVIQHLIKRKMMLVTHLLILRSQSMKSRWKNLKRTNTKGRSRKTLMKKKGW